ncbi:hypothetical protein DFH94DRAFT_688829 [Russula ochroleuca]|uniref:Uncharacterized protein n=1 Tax=Russula ochroleuca TaxID=152965 RepID=A0A9P5N4V5_9AGAM|nr:hypothetical protein DFH94DRAFT_688829 [Russula ochroleuca]
MSRQYQDPNYHSGQYQTPYPYPNPSQQSGQYTQPSPNPRDTYNDHSSQHAFSSYPTEGSLQPQPSGRRQSSHSPYAAPVPFPEPQGSSVGHPQTYLAPSQTTPHLTVGTHQQGYQSSYGYPPSTSDSQQFYAADRSDTGGSSNFYSQPGGGYSVAQPPDGNAAGYDNLRERPKAPGYLPAAGTHSNLYVDILVAVTLYLWTPESRSFGSGAATNICRLR